MGGTAEVIRCETLRAAGLFYTSPGNGRGVVVGETPYDVLRRSGRRWELDHAWLQDWLSNRADPTATPYLGMRRLPPGKELHLGTDGHVQVVDFNGPNVWPEPDLTGDEAIHTWVETFDSAIAELARDRECLTSELSGGLDSSYLVASLALQARRTGVPARIEALTHVPTPHARLPTPARGWIGTDEAAAKAVAHLYGDVVRWQPVAGHVGRTPLQVAREVSNRAWWPPYAPANIVWLDDLRNRAAASGSADIWVGMHGNASFSNVHRYHVSPEAPRPRRSLPAVAVSRGRTGNRQVRQLMRNRRVLPVSTLLVEEPPAPPEVHSREYYLRWLAGHTAVHQAIMNPAAFAVPSVDPFRHHAVVEIAARITPQAWRHLASTRGLARQAGVGRVPSHVRHRSTRGSQGADVWFWMHREAQAYREQVELLADTPAIADLVDIPAARSLVGALRWGSTAPPPTATLNRLNRVLAFAAFIRDTHARLRDFPAGNPPGHMGRAEE